jgi:predicted AlkP superfamily pyrophosphatase or phosphodiesterase
VPDSPVIPDYAGACISNVVPGLLDPTGTLPSWFPAEAAGFGQHVLLVLDGLGWNQLQARPHLAPTLSAMAGVPIHSVAPTTTATALTSITLGLAPGEHGIVGYRMDVDGDVLNVLRWGIGGRDARQSVPPEDFLATQPFLGMRPPVVSRSEFERSGFTMAHLAGTRHHGYRVVSSLVTEVRELLAEGEPFVYAYYDGLDKVGHEYGIGAHFDEELRALDRLTADLLESLPAGAGLFITADHGQVHTPDPSIVLEDDLAALCTHRSGEGRFRWLHARNGATDELLAGARDTYGDIAWVVTRDEAVADGWFGPSVASSVARRFGDVALVAKTLVSFDDPDDTGPFRLIGRHGSLTADEMLVPLLAGGTV